MKFLKKFVAWVLILSILLNQGLFVATAYADEPTPTPIETTPTPTEPPAPTPEPTITPSIVPTLTPSISPTPTETASQGATLTPTTTPTPSATLTPSLTPSPTASPTPTIIQSGNKFASFDESKKDPKKPQDEWAKGEILVQFKTSGDPAGLKDFAKSKGLEVVSNSKGSTTAVLRLKSDALVPTKIDELAKDPRIAHAERNFVRKPSILNTNDPRSTDLWGLDNTGQTIQYQTGTLDADIDLSEAWGTTQGSPSLIVAVIDTGIVYDHPDLTSSLWDGTNCKDENGNALGNCKYGYDFQDDDKDPYPSYSDWGSTASHGTHIAGTIAAAKNNGKGVVGIAPQVKIMSLKTHFSNYETIRAIDFARVNGARVINASYGDGGYSQAERDAIQRFTDAGGLFIAAAGNNFSDLDSGPFYPASYPIDGLINVAATDNQDHLAYFSNYDSKTVDIAAPGVDILSSVGDYGYSSAYEELFNALTPPSLPTGWTASGNWRTVNTQNSAWGTVLYPDASYPYSDNADMTISGPKINLTGALSTNIAFWARCDTEYNTQDWTDYMQLEVSKDGTNWNDVARFDEQTMDNDNDESNNSGPITDYISIYIPTIYATSDFQFRFRWITNGQDNNHEGCLVDDISIWKATLGTAEKYEFWSGTSMATPHVVGTAALLWSANPSLTNAQVKSIIMTTGDSISALTGKTLTGKRLNAAKALAAVKGPGVLGIADDPSPVQQKIWNWYADDLTTQFRFSIDQNPTASPSGAFGDVKTAQVSSGDGKYYLHVQAKTNGIEGAIITVYAMLDNTAPQQPQPTVPVSPPFPPNGNAQQFTWTLVDDTSGVVHYVYEVVNAVTGEVWNTGATISNQIWEYLSEGIWNFFIFAEDNAGNKSQVLSKTVTVDTTGATGTITAPIDMTWYKELPDVAATASDSATGIQYVNFWLQNASGGTCGGAGGCGGGDGGGIATSGIIATDFTAPYGSTDWEQGWELPTPEGQYSVWAEVYDNAGNRSETARVTFFYDHTAPTAPIVTTPSQAVRTNANTYTIGGTKQAGGHIKIYSGTTLIIEEEVFASKSASAQGGGGSGEESWSLDVPLQPNTANNFTASATDQAGNESTKTAVATITEDSNYPTITSYTISNTSISTQTTPGIKDTASIDLAFSETVNAEIIIFGTQNNVVRNQALGTTTNPNAWIWDGKDNNGNYVADDVYTIKIGATDLTGLGILDTSKTITVDNNTLSLNPIGNKQANEGTSLAFSVAGTDEEGLGITYGIINAPTGSFFNTITGQFTWTPSESQGPGLYLLSFTATNGSQTKSEAITITVNEVNLAPVVTNVSTGTSEEIAMTIPLSASDADVPSNSHTFAILSSPSHGTATLSGNTVIYTPSKDFFGTDNLTYQASDGLALSNVATITITVSNVNDAPVAVNDIVLTGKNTQVSIPATQLLSNDTDIDSSTLFILNAGSPTHGTVSISSSNILFTPQTDYVGVGSFEYTLSDGNLSTTGTVNVTITPPIEDDQVVLSPIVNIQPNAPEIVISDTSYDSIITIPANVTNATLNVTNIATTLGQTTSATILNDITVNASTTLGTMSMEIPAGISISAPSASWTGIINAPTLLSNSSVTAPNAAGTTTTTNAVVEVGFGDVPLTLDKAVRLVIAGQAGKLAGYMRNGVFTVISQTCSGDTQTTGDALPNNGDCKINAGSDLVIWTKHFTRFVAYTQTANSTSGSGSSGGGSSSGPYVCSDTKPGSAPVLLSARANGSNQVTLSWSKAKDPVSYYLVTYGTASGKQEYGNPNVGGNNATSYTVNGLSNGKTYYFRVRAGNGCKPGDFSNELSATAYGTIAVASVATGFQPGVLGTNTQAQPGSEEKAIEEVKGDSVKNTIKPTKIASQKNTIDEWRDLGWSGFIVMILLFLTTAGSLAYAFSKRATNPPSESGFTTLQILIGAGTILALAGSLFIFQAQLTKSNNAEAPPRSTKPTSIQEISPPPPATNNQPLPVQLSMKDLAKKLNTATSAITISTVEEVMWNDSSLGCPEKGMMYMQVIVPGYKVTLSDGTKTYEYHTDKSSAFKTCTKSN